MDEDASDWEDEMGEQTEAGTDYGSTFEADSDYDSDALPAAVQDPDFAAALGHTATPQV
jgi:hypothetical protein